MARSRATRRPPAPAPRLRSPQQARSRDTLRRILEATRKLLNEKTFAEISVTEITKRARSSVGAFYTRFPDKKALLDHLDELYAREVIAAAEELSRPERWVGASLADIVEAAIGFMVRFHRERPGLLRTLILEARQRPGGAFGERTERMKARIPGLLQILLRRKDDIHHPDPERAVTMGFVMVFSALRETILFPEALPEGAVSDDEELIRELTRAYLTYLQAEPLE